MQEVKDAAPAASSGARKTTKKGPKQVWDATTHAVRCLRALAVLGDIDLAALFAPKAPDNAMLQTCVRVVCLCLLLASAATMTACALPACADGAGRHQPGCSLRSEGP